MSEEEQAAVQTADLLRLKADALKRFAVIRNLYNKNAACARQERPAQQGLPAGAGPDLERIDEHPLWRQAVEALCDGLRKLVDRVRSNDARSWICT